MILIYNLISSDEYNKLVFWSRENSINTAKFEEFIERKKVGTRVSYQENSYILCELEVEFELRMITVPHWVQFEKNSFLMCGCCRHYPLDSSKTYFDIVNSYLSASTVVLKATSLLILMTLMESNRRSYWKIDFLTEKLRKIKIGRWHAVPQGLNPS